MYFFTVGEFDLSSQIAMESYDQVLASLKKKRRKINLLLGNGFSMAYDNKIFSYNALYDFITKIGDKDLVTIMSIIDSKNFEEIMRQLDQFGKLVKVFGSEPDLYNRITLTREKLRTGLLDAVQNLHPEHVFTIPEEQQKACINFLKPFLNSGSIFSTNYDLLLYWVLMRSKEIAPCDGFGRECENLENITQGEEQIWSDLRWGKNKDQQNVFYLHGALPFFDTGVEIEKEEYDTSDFLIKKISRRIENGSYPIFVTAGDGKQKLTHIMHNRYLTYCYEHLSEITGSLITFGFNFGSYDNHIIQAINKAAAQQPSEKLWSIYIGVYSEVDRQHIEAITAQFKCKKVKMFDAKTFNPWNS